MNKLRRDTIAKTLALLALTLFVLISLVLFCGVGVLQSFDAYSVKSMADCRLLDNLMDFQVETLADADVLFYEDSLNFRMDYGEERNGESLCNTVVMVTDPYGNEMLYNYHAKTIPSTERKLTLTYALPDMYNSEMVFYFTNGHDNSPQTVPCVVYDSFYMKKVSFREWLFDVKGINTRNMSDVEVDIQYFDDYYTEYMESIFAKEIFSVPDGYVNVTVGIAEDAAKPLSKEHLAIAGFENRWLILVTAIISGVISLVLTVFLALAAGWRQEGDRPVGTVIERIPLGLFLMISGGACWLVVALVKMLSNRSGNSVLNLLLFGLILYVLLLIIFSSLHSLNARFKCKDWTKNTVIYRLYVLFGWVANNLSDVGTALACAGGWLLINLILLAFALDHLGLGLLFMGIFNLVVAAALVAVVAQWQHLKKSAEVIANGGSSHRVETSKMFRALREHGNAINRMGEGVEAAVDEQMKSERMKTDLITNVSHDLKTPLTSIVNYVGLLKNESIENETARGYIDTLDRQATRLGRLIEDLVEASKATSGNIKATIIPISIGELLEQAVSEYEMRMEQSSITPVLNIHGDHLTALADGRLLWRVFDNLMSNVCKYGLDGTRLYIDARRERDRIIVTFRNISASQLNVPAEELMERFVRGDSSRTTSGSGLGLTIARSLVEVQNGTFSLEIEGDMFKVHVSLPTVDGKEITDTSM